MYTYLSKRENKQNWHKPENDQFYGLPRKMQKDPTAHSTCSPTVDSDSTYLLSYRFWTLQVTTFSLNQAQSNQL